MKPKWLPIALPGELTPYGELAFQPYLEKTKGIVVTGGPNGLFVVKVNEVVHKLPAIPAQVRISGFFVHGSDLFVQDGTVLSRWNLNDCMCSAAINLADTSRSWPVTGGPALPNWTHLHSLKAADAPRQARLQGARRRVEWLDLFESMQALSRDTSLTPDERTGTNLLLTQLDQLLGGNRTRARTELADAEKEAAALIFSAPVVRSHQVGAKAGALVFVIGRDGTLHPIDDNLKRMSTSRLDTSARPSLAITEWETDAHSDDFACRVYYVNGDGAVRAIDGNSLPPATAGIWPAVGPASLEPGIRPRVDSRVLWGNDAQGTGVFALPIDQPGSASQLTLPLTEKWRWLELPKVGHFALVCTDTRSQFVCFAPGAVTVDRFGARPALAPYYSSFLETGDRPLLVAEFEHEPQGTTTGPGYRVVVANTIDTPDRKSAAWYPPPPSTINSGTLEGFAPGKSPPASICAQVTVSLQDAYLVARDRTKRDQLRALAAGAAATSWRTYIEKVTAQYGTLAAAAAALGELAMPPMTGSYSLFCYSVGTTITSEQITEARAVLDRTREWAIPISLRCTEKRTVQRLGQPTRTFGPSPMMFNVTLRFSNGDSLTVKPDANGYVILPPARLGQVVTMDKQVSMMPADISVSSCKLEKKTGNEIMQTSFRVPPLSTP